MMQNAMWSLRRFRHQNLHRKAQGRKGLGIQGCGGADRTGKTTSFSYVLEKQALSLVRRETVWKPRRLGGGRVHALLQDMLL